MAVALVTDANAKKCCLVQDIMLKEITNGVYPHDLQPNTYGMTAMLAAAEASAGALDVHTEKAKPAADSRTRWEVAYQAKRCLAATEEECTDPFEVLTCVPNPWLYAQPVMSIPIHFEFCINMAQYRSICENNTQDLAKRLREAYNAMKRAANQRYIDQFQALVGNYWSGAVDCVGAVNSGTTPSSLHVLDLEGRPQPRGFYPLLQQYRRMGITERPLVVAGTYLDALEFQQLVYRDVGGSVIVDRNVGNFGTSLPNTFVDYDIDIDYSDGDAHAFSIVPGAVSRLFWNQFDGVNAYTSDRLVKQTFDLGAMFGDPGFVVDQTIGIVEGCDNLIVYKFYLSTDLFSIPTDAFNTTTCGQCSNYLLHWLMDCAAIDCTTFSGGIPEA